MTMMMKKDSKRRKRHTPPGPAGILFQTQQAASGKKKNTEKKHGGTFATTDGDDLDQPQQQQRQLQKEHADLSSSEDAEGEDNMWDTFTQSYEDDAHHHQQRRRRQLQHQDNVGFMTMSPSWAVMQQELNITTPYVDQLLDNSNNYGEDDSNNQYDDGDPHYQSKRRYDLLRPHMPKRFLLLFEIVRGQYDLGFGDDIDIKINQGNNYIRHDPYDFIYRSTAPALVVLVQSVQSSIHHNIWTVELTDETGATIRAWMEPAFIHEQLQISAGLRQPQANTNNKSNDEITTPTRQINGEVLPSPLQSPSSTTNCEYIIRPGVVWLLRKITIMPAIVSERGLLTVAGNGRLERMLLISGKHIAKAWVPEEAKFDENNDTPEKQERYLKWIQSRREITAQTEEQMGASKPSSSTVRLREHHEEDSEDTENDPDDNDNDIEIDHDSLLLEKSNNRNISSNNNKSNQVVESRTLIRELDYKMASAVDVHGDRNSNRDRRARTATATPAPPNNGSNPYTPHIVTGCQHKHPSQHDSKSVSDNVDSSTSSLRTSKEPVRAGSSSDSRPSNSLTAVGTQTSISQSLPQIRHVSELPTTRQSETQYSSQEEWQYSLIERSQERFSQRMETQPDTSIIASQIEDHIQTISNTSATATTSTRSGKSQQPPLSPLVQTTQPKEDTVGPNNSSIIATAKSPKSKSCSPDNATSNEQRKSSKKKCKKRDCRKISLSPKSPLEKKHQSGRNSIWDSAIADESIVALFDSNDNDGINVEINRKFADKEISLLSTMPKTNEETFPLSKQREGFDSIDEETDCDKKSRMPTQSMQGKEDRVKIAEPKKSIFDVPLDDDINLDDFDL